MCDLILTTHITCDTFKTHETCEMEVMVMYWLKEFRLKNNKTQGEMAKYIGVSKSLYEKIEYGDRSPSANFIKKFKEAFPNVDTNIFFNIKTHETCINIET